MNEIIHGVKNIEIHAKTQYPIVSAYEFEFLKTDNEIKALLKPCTIYFIIQRPLMYYNNFKTCDGLITFEIVDDSSSIPLQCSFIPSENKFCTEEEDIQVEVLFYKKYKDIKEPFNDVAAFKLLNINNEFLSWFSPQKFIYEFLSGSIKADINGDITKYIDYKVHYIGKAFSQDIWERLTGHEKMQKILTLEDSLNTKSLKAPFEISLLMLNINGFTEANIFPYNGFGLSKDCNPILHDISFEEDNDSFERFNSVALSSDSEQLTIEVEAMLINSFKPEKYNKVLYKNYPNIKNGTRSVGYSESTLIIELCPAILKTDNYTQNVIFTNHA